MRTTLFELEQGKAICRLNRITHSLEITDTESTKEGMVKITGTDALKEIRDQLDKFFFMVEAMEIDSTVDEVHASDLYGNNISIKYALEHGLLKRR